MPNRRPPTRNAFAARAPVLVDSGAWIALARARDQHHDEAEAWMRRAIRERVPLVTTTLIVAEVQRFLLFHTGIRPAAAFLDHLDASPSVTLVAPGLDEHRAARAWLARFADQRLTYTDAVSFAVMQAQRCAAALSFDSDFTIAGFRLGLP